VVKPAGAACAKCPARDGALLAPTFTATGRARLAIVDDAPSGMNFKEGQHVSGPAARMLQRGFAANGLPNLTACHRTSAVLCRCTPKEQVKAAKACGERLRAELAVVGATHVVALGALATQHLLGLKTSTPLTKYRGFVCRRDDGLTVLPIMHPWRAQQMPRWLPALEIDVARIGRVVEGGFTPPELLPGVSITFATTPESLAMSLAMLAESVEIGADVETVGLGPTSTSLVCVGLGTATHAVVIPWSKASNGQVPYWVNPDAVARDVRRLLASRTMVTHNGPAFDHIVLGRYGMPPGERWDDTLLMTHALAGHMPKGLAHIVSLYCDAPPWKTLEHAERIEDLWLYNARDVIYMMKAYQALRARMRAEAA
jgi:uracil-DNA glycosylase family 4